jgi:hypothetical protein
MHFSVEHSAYNPFLFAGRADRRLSRPWQGGGTPPRPKSDSYLSYSLAAAT